MNAMSGPTILVDADACPVKEEIVRVASRHGLPVVFVANQGMRPSRDPMVRHVLVSGSFDAADDWIVDHAKTGDVAVTADIPLAVRLVEKGVHAVTPMGRLLDSASIGMASAMRNLNQDLREAGAIPGYNAAFGPRDRSRFLQAFDSLVRKALRSSGLP